MDTVSLKEELHIDALAMRKAPRVYRAIKHKLRQQMLQLMDQHKQITVTEMYIK